MMAYQFGGKGASGDFETTLRASLDSTREVASHNLWVTNSYEVAPSLSVIVCGKSLCFLYRSTA